MASAPAAIMTAIGVPVAIAMTASTLFALVPASVPAVVVPAALPANAGVSVPEVIMPAMTAIDPVAGAVVVVPTVVESIIPVVRDEKRIVIDHNCRRRDYDGGRRYYHRRGRHYDRCSNMDANANMYLGLGVRRRKVHGQYKSKSCECGFLKHLESSMARLY